MRTKLIKLLQYEFKIYKPFLERVDNRNKKHNIPISSHLTVEGFIEELYNCYEQCEPIYEEPAENKRRYLELLDTDNPQIKFDNIQNGLIYGTLKRGSFPYKPELIDAETHEKKRNPKGEKDIEPYIGHFFLIIEDTDPIIGKLFLQATFKNAFKKLFAKLLECKFTDFGLKLYSGYIEEHINDRSSINDIKIESIENIFISVEELVDQDVFRKILEADRVVQIEIKGVNGNLDTIEREYYKETKREITNISKDYILKIDKKGSSLDEGLLNWLLNKFQSKELPAGNLKIKIVDEGIPDIINLSQLQPKISLEIEVDNETGIISSQDLVRKFKNSLIL